ncbi:glycoside hydrolase family 47 protein [Cyathus striatus]|nr:glycoside hydrolase family 47 protein [Cyathus striatus]
MSADVGKRDAVVEAFKHAWSAYEKDAMGCDEYHPITHTGSNLTSAGGIGYMVVDAMDTMQIMGLSEEYGRARRWVEDELTFERDGNFNTFETTIRVLGGLLASYHLSSPPDELLLSKARDLTDRLMTTFNTPSGLPMGMVNLAKREGVDHPDVQGLVSTAEAATLQLELRDLAWLQDDDDVWDKAEGVMKVVKAARIPSGLAPIYINSDSGQFTLSEIRLGSRGDSFYEYLLKQYLQTGKTEEVYREMYEDAMQAIHNTLIQKGIHQNLTLTTELLPSRQHTGETQWRLSPKQDHLVCFLAGSLMHGAVTTAATVPKVSVPPLADELTDIGKRDWTTGRELLDTCLETYDTPTGLAAEIVHFYIPSDSGADAAEKDWYIKSTGIPGQPSYDARYMLRPETVESLFFAYRLTGDKKYREQGWRIFQAIEKYCKLPEGGYATILDVENVRSELEDKMETFFLSETLKYLYLLFDDSSVLPLDEYVFNTEAHPLPIFTPTRKAFF